MREKLSESSPSQRIPVMNSVGLQGVKRTQHRIASTNQHATHMGTKKNISRGVCGAVQRRRSRENRSKSSPSPECPDAAVTSTSGITVTTPAGRVGRKKAPARIPPEIKAWPSLGVGTVSEQVGIGLLWRVAPVWCLCANGGLQRGFVVPGVYPLRGGGVAERTHRTVGSSRPARRPSAGRAWGHRRA